MTILHEGDVEDFYRSLAGQHYKPEDMADGRIPLGRELNAFYADRQTTHEVPPQEIISVGAAAVSGEFAPTNQNS